MSFYIASKSTVLNYIAEVSSLGLATIGLSCHFTHIFVEPYTKYRSDKGFKMSVRLSVRANFNSSDWSTQFMRAELTNVSSLLGSNMRDY